MSTEHIDLLARKFVGATQNRPVYVEWGTEPIHYTADDAAAFLQYGDESAPSLTDAFFDESQTREMALDEAALYWLQDEAKKWRDL